MKPVIITAMAFVCVIVAVFGIGFAITFTWQEIDPEG